MSKFLCRHGVHRPDSIKKPWTKKFLEWVKSGVHFEHTALELTLSHYVHEVEHCAERIEWLEEAIDQAVAAAPADIREVIAALQAMRGIAQITATTIVSEIGSFSRFASPRELMGYSGLVPREHSSGNKVMRGAITKCGNAHLRRVTVEAAWAYQRRPWVGGYLAKRQQGLDPAIKDIAWKAQLRLHSRYKKLAASGKNKPQIITAVGREMLGFIWAIAVKVERQHGQARQAAA